MADAKTTDTPASPRPDGPWNAAPAALRDRNPHRAEGCRKMSNDPSRTGADTRKLVDPGTGAMRS
jgi:hypothetical protein